MTTQSIDVNKVNQAGKVSLVAGHGSGSYRQGSNKNLKVKFKNFQVHFLDETTLFKNIYHNSKN